MVLFLLAMLAVPGTGASGGVLGYWEGPTHSVVHIEPCGSAFCAKIVKLPADAPATTDIHNPDAARHTRPLCGVDIGTGFQQTGPEKLEGGELYDPTTGKTYKGSMTAEGDVLKLRGYVGISLFGKSQTWRRVGPVEACGSGGKGESHSVKLR